MRAHDLRSVQDLKAMLPSLPFASARRLQRRCTVVKALNTCRRSCHIPTTNAVGATQHKKGGRCQTEAQQQMWGVGSWRACVHMCLGWELLGHSHSLKGYDWGFVEVTF